MAASERFTVHFYQLYKGNSSTVQCHITSYSVITTIVSIIPSTMEEIDLNAAHPHPHPITSSSPFPTKFGTLAYYTMSLDDCIKILMRGSHQVSKNDNRYTA